MAAKQERHHPSKQSDGNPRTRISLRKTRDITEDEEASSNWSTERWLVEFRSASELHAFKLRPSGAAYSKHHPSVLKSEADKQKMGDEVFIPNRRQTVRPHMDFDALSDEFTTSTPVVTAFKAGTTLTQAIPSATSNTSLSKKWRKKLLAFTNAEAAGPTSIEGDPVPSSTMQEELQEWLDNLQWRMTEAEHNPPHAPASGAQTGGRRMTYALPSSMHYPLHHLKLSPTSSDTEDEKLAPLSLLPSSTHRNRSRSITSVDELVITDRNYMEQLQRLLQEASISSLQERMEERKVKEVSKADPTVVAPSRKKSYEKAKMRKKSSTKMKTSPRSCETLLLSETDASTSSTLKTESRNSTISRDHSRSQEDAKLASKSIAILKKDAAASISSPNSAVQLPEINPAMHTNLASEPLWNMLEHVESVDEIYTIAEALVLPPARPEPAIPMPPTPPPETLQWAEDMGVYPDEEEEEEDIEFT